MPRQSFRAKRGGSRTPVKSQSKLTQPILTSHEGHVNSVAVLQDGRRALSGSADQTVRLWDLETGAELRRFEAYKEVCAVAALPDGQRAIFAALEAGWLWDLEAWVELRQLAGSMWSVAVLPDGRWALSGSLDGTIRLWEIDTGAELRKFNGHNEWVYSVAALPDGRRALSGSLDGTMRLWDLYTGAELRRFEGDKGGVRSVAALPDGRRALSLSDQVMQLWDLETGAVLREFAPGGLSIAVLPGGHRAVVAHYGNTLKLWNLQTGAELRRFEGHTTVVNAVAMLPDGRRAISVPGMRPCACGISSRPAKIRMRLAI
jgi:WD40 repeat protein